MKYADANAQTVEVLTLPELCRFCDADDAWIMEMVDHGVLEPRGRTRAEWTFRALHIARAKKARRLSRDLDVNAAGIALILDLLEERDALRRRLSLLEDH